MATSDGVVVGVVLGSVERYDLSSRIRKRNTDFAYDSVAYNQVLVLVLPATTSFPAICGANYLTLFLFKE